MTLRSAFARAPKRHAVWVTLATGLGCVLLALAFRPKESRDTPSGPKGTRNPVSNVEPAIDDDAPPSRLLDPESSRTQPSVADDAPAATAATAQAAAAALEIAGSVILHGSSEARPTVELALVGLSRFQAQPRTTEPVDENLAFRANVSRWLSRVVDDGLAIEVKATCPGFAADAVTVTRDTIAQALRDAPDDRCVRVQLVLESGCRVIGRVVTADGRAVPGATVALHVRASTRVRPAILIRTETKADGRFELTTAHYDELRLNVFADEHPALHRDLTTARAKTVDCGTIELEPGALIRGRIVPSAPDFPKGAVRMSLVKGGEGKGETLDCGNVSLYWNGERFEHYVRLTWTDDEGRFEFAGLLPGSFALSVNGPESSCVWGNVDHCWMHVSAPDENVVFTVDVPLSRFEVYDDLGPVAAANVTLQAPNATYTCETGLTGMSNWITSPDVPCRVTVSHADHRSATFDWVTPSNGGVAAREIELQRADNDGALRLKVEDEQSRPVTSVVATFDSAGDPSTAASFERWDDSHQGSFAFRRLPVGRYDVLIHAKSTELDHAFLLDARLRVQLAPGKTTTEKLQLRTGGRMELRVREHDGALSKARCTIVDARGVEVPVAFCTTDPLTGTIYTDPYRPMRAGLPPDIWAAVRDSLEPGRYSMRVACDSGSVLTREFEIVKGQCLRLDIECGAQ